MAEKFHDRARVDALGEQKRRCTMPQVVKSEGGRQLSLLEKRLVVAVENDRFDRPSTTVRKNEILILPGGAGRKAVLCLSRAMNSQCSDHGIGKCNRASTSVCFGFGGAELAFLSLLLGTGADTLHGLADAQCALV